LTPSLLRQDAESIWRAGVRAVESRALVAEAVRFDGATLSVCGEPFPLAALGRVAVVGAGKAGAGMAAAFEESLGPGFPLDKLSGWVNVPADCAVPLRKIELHAARAPGENEPTAAGVQGTERILELVGGLGTDDLCVVLLSGGGSALLPAPVPEISLDDKLAVTRLLMNGGATIRELNCVRKRLSRVKGGGLARLTRAGRTIALIISDIVGDPLDMIASGPTVPDPSTPADALRVLEKYARPAERVPQSVWDYLRQAAAQPASHTPNDRVRNVILGNNARAVEAAAARARALGYTVHSLGSANEGEARDEGQALAELCRTIRERGAPIARPACILSGGEPVVHLSPSTEPRKGGRNQELALGALAALWDAGLEGVAILSGGTDGEDGPTDAAGAVADEDVRQRARQLGLDPPPYLAAHNSYPFFEQTGGLFKTGPTHTNVMDLRVALVRGPA